MGEDFREINSHLLNQQLRIRWRKNTAAAAAAGEYKTAPGRTVVPCATGAVGARLYILNAEVYFTPAPPLAALPQPVTPLTLRLSSSRASKT